MFYLVLCIVLWLIYFLYTVSRLGVADGYARLLIKPENNTAMEFVISPLAAADPGSGEVEGTETKKLSFPSRIPCCKGKNMPWAFREAFELGQSHALEKETRHAHHLASADFTVKNYNVCEPRWPMEIKPEPQKESVVEPRMNLSA